MFNFLKRKIKTKDDLTEENFANENMPTFNQMLFRASLDKIPRNKDWNNLRLKIIKQSGSICQCCKSKNNLTVHHIKPFHLFPELEMTESNLIVLCENHVLNCHYVIGHNFDWTAYNQDVIADSDHFKNMIEKRLYK